MAEPAAPPTTPPYPPRYRWLKRLLGVGLLMVLLLVGLRLWWGHRANARYHALIAEIEATGDPIHFQDLVIDPVPDKDNKAYHFRQAMAAWPTVPGQGVVITDTDWYMDPEQHPDPITDNAAYLQQLQPVLAHLRAMDAAPGCDWGVRPVSPVIQNWQMPPYGEMRGLARLIQDAAKRANAAGDAAGAIEWIRLTLAIGAAANDEYPAVIGQVVTISINALACGVVEEMTPTLVLPADAAAPARRQARALLDRLLDEQALQRGRLRAWVGERWVFHDAVRAIVEGRVGITTIMHSGGQPGLADQLALAFFKPVIVNDAAYLQTCMTALVEASRTATTGPAFDAAVEAQLGLDRFDRIEEHRLLHPLSASSLPGLSAVSHTHTQFTATQRMAATALAIRLYQADHGPRPEKLDELVPDYLPAVPRDPYTLDQPIRYRPQGASLVVDSYHSQPPVLAEPGPAILYCVGKNGRDDGGAVELDGGGQLYNNGRFGEHADHWFLLDPEPGPYTLP